MPELPDVTLYIEALSSRLTGASLERIRFASPFVLRTVDPSPEALAGGAVGRIRRIGKRIAIEIGSRRWIVIHLMIAGRLQWEESPKKLAAKTALAAFDFSSGTLVLTEAGSKKRASIHIVEGDEALAALDAGGIDPLTASGEAFRERLTRENHTLKRALTDPRLFSGIGNAYSDEILHRARLSPLQTTARLTPEEIERLREATGATLEEWTRRLRDEAGGAFPKKVTAFRPGMAVHGRYGQPCPDCGAPVQRIVYAENETNYCARCQTGGRLLADRALSRLLHDDWPRSLDEL
ncbi:MAG: Fpg/Nei family DNA glycosylase [Thermoanaerobaculia bacterium]